MRHAHRLGRLARRSEHYEATMALMARNVVLHGKIRTTLPKAKHAQRLVERLISLGKEGSVHSRRQAYRVLQDREIVKKLFADVAPRFLDCRGGYTRVLKLSVRPGDGAPQALLALTRLPAEAPKAPPKTKKTPKAAPSPESEGPKAPKEEKDKGPQKPKRFLEGLRELFRSKKGTQEP